MFNILLLLNFRLFLLCVNRCVGRFHGKRAITSDAWSFVPEGMKMGLLVGEQSEDDEGGGAAGPKAIPV